MSKRSFIKFLLICGRQPCFINLALDNATSTIKNHLDSNDWIVQEFENHTEIFSVKSCHFTRYLPGLLPYELNSSVHATVVRF